ncbi:MAG: Na(+)/H(+) antiporter subunit C [Microbacteriaceae bacterium]|nr:Na(+)/H(+) antiporter subunit C [Microbacteriaceae bacterium]
MSVSLALLLAMVALYAAGFIMMLERGMTRILIGFLLVGNATNLLILLMSGRFGKAPLVSKDNTTAADMSDPLPQALILTSIVITFAVSAFLLALIYRSYRRAPIDDDVVLDDADDVKLTHSDVAEVDEEASDTEIASESSDFDTNDDGIDDRTQEISVLTDTTADQSERSA